MNRNVGSFCAIVYKSIKKKKCVDHSRIRMHEPRFTIIYMGDGVGVGGYEAGPSKEIVSNFALKTHTKKALKPHRKSVDILRFSRIRNLVMIFTKKGWSGIIYIPL